MKKHSKRPWIQWFSTIPCSVPALVVLMTAREIMAQTASSPATDSAPGEMSGEENSIRIPMLDYLGGLKIIDISLWQFIVLIALAVAAAILGLLVVKVVFRLLLSIASRSATPWDDALLERIVAPTRLAVAVALYYAGASAFSLSEQGKSAVAAICGFFAIAAVAWLLARLVDLFADHVAAVSDAKGNTAVKTLVPLGRRATKVFIVVIAALSVLQNQGFNISGLLAGLGIGGLAIALAAQKTLENLFGGFVLVADRPVRIGEFCRIGEHVGTIEDIGLRSSRIRTLDRTVVTIPNAELSTVRIENYGVRDKVRLYTVLQVGYDTSPDQMRFLLVELRRMLYAHPKTQPDPCRVRFINLGAYSLDIEVFAFIDTQDWNEYTGIREDIYLKFLDIVEQSGACFAYPSQTLYLGRDPGRDMERTRAAETAVEKWRSADKLPMPEFSEEMIAQIDNTLDYPPRGSLRREPAKAPEAK